VDGYDVPAEGAENNAIKEEGWYLNDKKAVICILFSKRCCAQRFDFEEQQEPAAADQAKVCLSAGLGRRSEGLVAVK